MGSAQYIFKARPKCSVPLLRLAKDLGCAAKGRRPDWLKMLPFPQDLRPTRAPLTSPVAAPDTKRMLTMLAISYHGLGFVRAGAYICQQIIFTSDLLIGGPEEASGAGLHSPPRTEQNSNPPFSH